MYLEKQSQSLFYVLSEKASVLTQVLFDTLYRKQLSVYKKGGNEWKTPLNFRVLIIDIYLSFINE